MRQEYINGTFNGSSSPAVVTADVTADATTTAAAASGGLSRAATHAGELSMRARDVTSASSPPNASEGSLSDNDVMLVDIEKPAVVSTPELQAPHTSGQPMPSIREHRPGGQSDDLLKDWSSSSFSNIVTNTPSSYGYQAVVPAHRAVAPSYIWRGISSTTPRYGGNVQYPATAYLHRNTPGLNHQTQRPQFVPVTRQFPPPGGVASGHSQPMNAAHARLQPAQYQPFCQQPTAAPAAGRDVTHARVRQRVQQYERQNKSASYPYVNP